MRRYIAIACAFGAIIASPQLAQDMKAGARVTVQSDWHTQNGGPYSPKVISCNSDSGLCLKDTRGKRALHRLSRTDTGLQAVCEDFNIVYLFRDGGKGTFHNLSGRQVGTFTWTQ